MLYCQFKHMSSYKQCDSINMTTLKVVTVGTLAVYINYFLLSTIRLNNKKTFDFNVVAWLLHTYLRKSRCSNLNCKSWYICATVARVPYTKVLTLLNRTVQTMHRTVKFQMYFKSVWEGQMDHHLLFFFK